MSQHVFSLRTNFIIFGILMALLVLTVVVALALDLGAFEVPVAMTIAMVKAVLIMMYFMHLKFSSKLTWLFASSGLLWLVILIAFTMSDFLSRGWLSPIVTAEIPRDLAIDYFGGLPDPDTAFEGSAGEIPHGHGSGEGVPAEH
jgi:cytochrome c oxidase subunit 4